MTIAEIHGKISSSGSNLTDKQEDLLTSDVFGSFNLGPLESTKVGYNSKKGKLKVKAIVPAGLEPGIIQISVGECFGEIEIL